MEKFKFLSRKEISKFPRAPGVYSFKKNGKFLYIGKASNLNQRIKSHHELINLAKQIGYIKTDSEIEALILEATLIKKHQPKYNVAWRDDKNYFYVEVTNEEFPRIFITHQPLSAITFDRNLLRKKNVGPFVDGKALKHTLKVLRKVFPYRSCKTPPKRPCLWYHLNRCLAPCLLKSKESSLLCSSRISSKLQGGIKKIAQRNAKNIIAILQGKKTLVLKNLKREMKKASILKKFERAAKIRDQIIALEKVLSHTKIIEEQIVPQTSLWYYLEKKLRNLLKRKGEISRIEAYDVSNIQGQEATGSMVTFINGRPEKKFYRRFKIKTTGKPNDVAMLKEILDRRFKHSEWGWPDLILVDGGRAQLTVVFQVLNQYKKISQLKSVSIIALAKKKNQLFIEKEKGSIFLKNLPPEIFNLFLQLRDEAHRFARSYHRKLRLKVLLN